MGLSDDQRAMLRLLAQREQGYEDIAALMGISVEQVRERVGEALAQLEAEGKEAPAVPDPLAKEEPLAPPPPPAPTEEEPPAAAEAAPPAESPPPPPPEQPSTGSKSKLPKDPAIRAAIAAGILVFALFGVILIINSSSGGSDSSASSEATAAETTSSANTGDGESAEKAEGKLTKAVLEPVDGSGATGVAIFGRVGKKLALQVEAEGLEPSSKGTSYTLWLAQSPQRMLPLAETAVPKSGRIAARFEVPVELIAYLASETFDQLVITRTEDAKLNAALAVATKKKATPTYTGDPVLAGTVTGPIVGIAKRAQSE